MTGSKRYVNDYVFDDGEPTHNTQRYSVAGCLFTFLSGIMNKDSGTHDIEKPAGAIGIRGRWFATRPGELAGQEEVYLSTGDFNNNGVTNAQDTGLFRTLLGSPPGPSGLQP